jgi:hypothetical protein
MRWISRIAVIFALMAMPLFMSGLVQAQSDVMDPAAGQAMEAAMPSQLAAGISWVNQYGSVLTFTVGTSGQISGTYVNNAPGTGCQGTAYPVIGWVANYTIAWSVIWNNSFQNCNSMTAWAGYYDSSSGTIQSKWSLAYSVGSGGSVSTGADIFKPY